MKGFPRSRAIHFILTMKGRPEFPPMLARPWGGLILRSQLRPTQCLEIAALLSDEQGGQPGSYILLPK
jgi:hypothetical protein